jgi:hypothetical protein
MRLREQGGDISFERGEAVFLRLLLIISYHYDMTHRKRSIHISHEHGDTVHTSTSTLSNNHSMKSAYGMHMRESVSFARFQCAQMRVFVHQGLAESSHASFRASTGSSVGRNVYHRRSSFRDASFMSLDLTRSMRTR